MHEIFANVLVTKNRSHHNCTRQEGTKCVRLGLSGYGFVCCSVAIISLLEQHCHDFPDYSDSPNMCLVQEDSLHGL